LVGFEKEERKKNEKGKKGRKKGKKRKEIRNDESQTEIPNEMYITTHTHTHTHTQKNGSFCYFFYHPQQTCNKAPLGP
jgi:hypothetical protein